MRDWLAVSAETLPQHPFIVTPSATMTFAQVEERVRLAAGALAAAGVGVGDRIGVWAGSDLPTVVSLFAVPRTGAVVVPVNRRLGAEEASAQVLAAGCRLLIGEDAPPVGLPDPPRLDGPKQEPGSYSGDHSVFFTSGSHGVPRGVRLSWGNLEASAAASAAHLDHAPHDRWLCVLPLHHVGGFSILVRSARQGTTVLLEPRFEPERAAGLLDGEATLASLVAVMLRRILDVDPGPFRRPRAVLLGGGPSPQELLEEAAEAGLPVLPTYGMTETASQIATARLDDGFRPVRRLYPLRGAEIGVGADGVIRVRGPMVSRGYLGGPDRNPDEWLVTGDLGEIEGDGLVVLGRADEVIVTGGENVHPREVEAVLEAHRGVREVAVVGTPDPTWGSVITAVYAGEVPPGELERHARYRLAGFKIPRRWLQVPELPRLPVGKVDLEAVRRMARQ